MQSEEDWDDGEDWDDDYDDSDSSSILDMELATKMKLAGAVGIALLIILSSTIFTNFGFYSGAGSISVLIDVNEGKDASDNGKKNKLFYGKSCKQVTGLSVNEFPNVPRKLIRSIRQDLYLWEKHGHAHANDIIHDRRNYRHKKCSKRLCNMLHGKHEGAMYVAYYIAPLVHRFCHAYYCNMWHG